MVLSPYGVPIFLMQLVLGKRGAAGDRFYLSLYGLKFQRFVRMFQRTHRGAPAQVLFPGNGISLRATWNFLGTCMGTFGTGPDRRTCVSTIERTAADDTRNTMGYDRTSRLDSMDLSDNIWTVRGWLLRDFKAHGDEKNRKRMLGGMARYYATSSVFNYVGELGRLLCGSHSVHEFSTPSPHGCSTLSATQNILKIISLIP